MGNAIKFILFAVLAIVGISIALKIVGVVVGGIINLILNLLVPAAILLGILYVIYALTGKKSLGGGGRSLPKF